MDKCIYAVVITVALAAVGCGPRTSEGGIRDDGTAGRNAAAEVPCEGGRTVAVTADKTHPTKTAPATLPAGVEVNRDERWIMIDLVPSQRHAYDKQVDANRRGGGHKVTIHFTSGQLDAIRGAFPACRETSITWDARCIFEYRVALRFDAQDRIITPAPSYTSR